MPLPPHYNALSVPIPPLRAEIVLAHETVMALSQEIARLIIGILQKLLQEAQAAQERALLTPEEVARHFQVNRQWVYERTCRNEIPHIKVGKYLRFQRQGGEGGGEKMEKVGRRGNAGVHRREHPTLEGKPWHEARESTNGAASGGSDT